MRATHALSALAAAGIASTSVAGLGVPYKRAPKHWMSVHLSTSNPDDDPFGFQNINNNVYTGNLTVSGETFVVQLDTGSSDLWLDTENTTLSGLTDTGVVGSILYVDGTGAVGNIKLGNVTFGNVSVASQAFIDAPGSNATIGGSISGLLGVGPPLLSNVKAQLAAANSTVDGSPFLDNLFDDNPDEPNFMTFLLSRSAIGTVDGGDFTIGTVDPDLPEILNASKLQVVSEDNWFTFMDAVNVNGQVISGGSLGSPEVNIPDTKTLVLLDTGTSLSTGPPEYVNAMFDVPGVQFDEDSGFFILPCDSKINVSMVFGEDEFPVDPLDMIVPAGIDDANNPICIGAFTFSPNNAGVDFILGDVFLRNVYSLFDFGTFSAKATNDPSLQILSVTDKNQAWANFDSMNNARLQAFVQSQLNPSSSSNSSSPSPSGSGGPSRPNFTGLGNGGSGTGIKDKNVSGAIAEDTTNSSLNSKTASDLNNLITLTYVVIGLLGAIVLFLVGAVAAVLLRARRAAGRGYKALKDPKSFPPAAAGEGGDGKGPGLYGGEGEWKGSYKDYETPYDGGHH